MRSYSDNKNEFWLPYPQHLNKFDYLLTLTHVDQLNFLNFSLPSFMLCRARKDVICNFSSVFGSLYVRNL